MNGVGANSLPSNRGEIEMRDSHWIRRAACITTIMLFAVTAGVTAQCWMCIEATCEDDPDPPGFLGMTGCIDIHPPGQDICSLSGQLCSWPMGMIGPDGTAIIEPGSKLTLETKDVDQLASLQPVLAEHIDNPNSVAKVFWTDCGGMVAERAYAAPIALAMRHVTAQLTF